uniref:BPL/LPL catalytic domain-containing protein n=1 Tax=Plectus sambesii TaxID=2011161 RepID=A0A914VV78_9BILA
MRFLSSSCNALARVATVYLSRSTCIFENLAFEEWLFRNHDLAAKGEALLVWSNRPTVVIGRHQNPWIEANVPYLQEHGIALVRRHSGGGTVYHDLDNVNFSFLTEHARHCRPRNLRLIAAALNKEFGFNLTPTKRDDILLQPNDRKVSGTAARIARNRAYHHLTLLVNVDLRTLSASLRSSYLDKIETNATRSTVAARVGYLRQDRKNIDKDRVVETVVRAFSEQFEAVESRIVENVLDQHRFPGVVETYDELRGWQWLFGHTPKFTASLPSGVSVTVEKGIITSVENAAVESKSLLGQRFCQKMLAV